MTRSAAQESWEIVRAISEMLAKLGFVRYEIMIKTPSFWSCEIEVKVEKRG